MKTSNAFSASSRTVPLLAGLGSAMLFTVMGIAVAATAGEVSAEGAVAVRGLVGVIALAPMAWKTLGKIDRESLFWLVSRSVFGALGILCLFINFQSAGVSVSIALANLIPLFVLGLSMVIAREPLSRRDYLSIGMLIAGAFTLQSPFGSALSFKILATGVSGAFFAALAFVSLRKAAQKISHAAIVWSFSLGVFLVGGSMAGFKIAPSSSRAIALTLLAALAGLFGQILMTRAFASLPAAIASALALTSLIWGLFFEVVFEHQLPTIGATAGYLLIIIGAFALNTRTRPALKYNAKQQT